MTTLVEFRNARRTFNARFPDGRKVIEEVSDFALEPNAQLVHRYEIGGQIGIIIERHRPGYGNEYAYLFLHPCDSVEKTREKAEEELFAFLFAYG